MASAEDMALLRNVRRELNKLPLDSSRVEISGIKGVIYFTGSISPTKEGGEDGAIIYVKSEMADLVFKLSHMPGVKQVVNGCKMVEAKPKPVRKRVAAL